MIVIAATPRVGGTALLRSLASVLPGSAEYPDATGGATLIHWTQMPVEITGTWVYLHRRDRLAQAVSFAVAASIGRYHSTQEPTQDPHPPPDIAAIDRAIRTLDEHDQAWCSYLTDKDPLILSFEDDIREDPRVGARRVLDHAGLTGEPEAPDLRPIDGDVKAVWIQAWRERHDAVACEEEGQSVLRP